MRTIINVVCFQLAWFASVCGAANGFAFLGPVVVACVVAVHLSLAPRESRNRELLVLLIALLVGFGVETLHVWTGDFVAQPGEIVRWSCPLWLAALWVNLACTLTRSLRWLSAKPLLAAILGATGGPLSYYAGARMGAIKLDPNLCFSLAVLAVVWGIVMPSLLWPARRIVPSEVATSSSHTSRRQACP